MYYTRKLLVISTSLCLGHSQSLILAVTNWVFFFSIAEGNSQVLEKSGGQGEKTFATCLRVHQELWIPSFSLLIKEDEREHKRKRTSLQHTGIPRGQESFFTVVLRTVCVFCSAESFCSIFSLSLGFSKFAPTVRCVNTVR